jgi:hypothetical protein
MARPIVGSMGKAISTFRDRPAGFVGGVWEVGRFTRTYFASFLSEGHTTLLHCSIEIRTAYHCPREVIDRIIVGMLSHRFLIER